jgi:hypothetical protein
VATSPLLFLGRCFALVLLGRAGALGTKRGL